MDEEELYGYYGLERLPLHTYIYLAALFYTFFSRRTPLVPDFPLNAIRRMIRIYILYIRLKLEISN